MQDVILPNDRTAELAALGSMMLDTEAAAIGIERLSDSDFFDPGVKVVFGAVKNLFEADSPTDFASVLSELSRTRNLETCGQVVSEAHQTTVTSANIEHHIHTLKTCQGLRNVYREGISLAQDAVRSGVKLETITQRIESLYSSVIDEAGNTGFVHISHGLSDLLDQVERITKGDELPAGVTTGIFNIDKEINLRPGELSILAAGASVGKSAMAVDNIAVNVARTHKATVGIFSLEMSFEQLQMRIICSEHKLDIHDFQNGELSLDTIKDVMKGISSIASLPIYIDATGYIHLSVLKSRARRLKKRFPDMALLIVDYLQLVDQSAVRNQSREQEVSKITRTLKGLAKELNIHVMALSQLSRDHERRTPPYPQLRDLRESGAIEQDADIVLFIYRKRVMKEDPATGRPEMDFHNDGVVIVAKNRNGRTGGVCDVWFDAKSCKFHAGSKREDAPPSYIDKAEMDAVIAGTDNLPF